MINDLNNPVEPSGTQHSVLTGHRIRLLRESRGMSQRKLASLAGMTNGAVSMIEQDRVSPSVASLKKLLEVLGMSLCDFFADDFQPAGQVFFRAPEMTRIADGPVVLRQLGGAIAGRSLQMLHETYQVGGDTGPELLSHEGEEAGIVVMGQVEVTVGRESQLLGPGDGYYFNSRQPHRFRNPGPGPCEIVSCCSPPTF